MFCFQSLLLYLNSNAKMSTQNKREDQAWSRIESYHTLRLRRQLFQDDVTRMWARDAPTVATLLHTQRMTLEAFKSSWIWGSHEKGLNSNCQFAGSWRSAKKATKHGMYELEAALSIRILKLPSTQTFMKQKFIHIFKLISCYNITWQSVGIFSAGHHL